MAKLKAKDKKNILILTWRDLIDNDNYGGNEVYIDRIANGLSEENNVTVFSSKDKNQKKEEVVNNVRYLRKGSRITVYFWAFLYYLFKFRKNIDFIIDVENGVPFFTPLYSKKPKVLLVHHFHNGQWFSEFPYPIAVVGYTVERALMPRVYKNNRVVTVSNSSKLDLEFLGINSDNIQVAYNGKEIKASSNASSLYSKPTMLYLGRLREYKRIDLAVKAVYDLREKGLDVDLIIAGQGDDENRLKEIAKTLRVKENVKFLGFVDEKKKNSLLKKSWVYVNPSSKEGWGIVNIEANHFGTPVVGFNVYGIRDSVNDGYSGYLANDYDAFTNSLYELLSDSQKVLDFNTNCKEWSNRFKWETTVAAFNNEIRKQLGIKGKKKVGINNPKYAEVFA